MCQRLLIPITVFAVGSLLIMGCGTTSNQPARADANHDDQFSQDEINKYVVTRVFKSRDANRDDRLTRKEWLAGNDADQEKLFRERDANQDGVVTLKEALAYGRKEGDPR